MSALPKGQAAVAEQERVVLDIEFSPSWETWRSARFSKRQKARSRTYLAEPNGQSRSNVHLDIEFFVTSSLGAMFFFDALLFFMPVVVPFFMAL